jgi:O-antigen biosynthesis protein WbqP
MASSLYHRWGKRAFDVTVAAAGLVILSPVLLMVALAIRAYDGGPALFRQIRVGRRGEPFELLKFRSMSVGVPNVPSASASALTVTPIGAALRRLNIDELPQLVNVLRGDMSLVGPRPALPVQSELCRMRQSAGVLDCSPGLTGLAQVNAVDGMPDTRKVEWDARYARSVSFATDLRIVIQTIGYLVRRPPVY